MRVTTVLPLLLVSLLGGAARADDVDGAADPEKAALPEPAASSSPLDEAEKIPGDVIFMRLSDGRLVPVPANADLQEWLSRKNTRTKETEQRTYSVTRVAVSGRAEDDWATLTVQFVVQTEDAGWTRVPLRLDEAVLRDFSHEFLTGEEAEDDESVARAAYAGRVSGEGLTWRLHGAGRHRLELDVLVPVRSQLPARRLQLALPESAVSDATITVPMQPVAVKPPPGSQTRTATVGQTSTRIQVYGLGRRLDLTWEPLPDTQEIQPVLEAFTAIDVRPNDATTVVVVTQTIQPLRGSFDEVLVQLPHGYEVRGLSARFLGSPGGEFSGFESTEADARRVRVPLPSPLVGRERLELRWTLETIAPRMEGGLLLEGFGVQHARAESGEIAVGALEGHRVSVRGDEHRNVHQIDVSELSENGNTALAYRFLKQPFRLVVDVERIEPYFSVEPVVRLGFGAEAIELDATFDVTVFRGVLDELVLNWPGLTRQDWSLSPLEAPGLVERVEVDEEQGEQVRLHLAERQSGAFSVKVRATLPLPEGEAETAFDLPGVASANTVSTLLAAWDAVDVESSLRPVDETVVRTLTVAELSRGPLRSAAPGPRARYLRVASAKRRFRVRVEKMDRVVDVTSRTRLREREGRLQVRQQLACDVSFGRLSQLRLALPSSLAGDVEFVLDDELPLIADWSEGPDGDAEQSRVVLALPDERSGTFAVEARFLMPLDHDVWPGGREALALPVLQPLNADTVTYELLAEDDRFTVLPKADSWTRQRSFEGRITWSSPTTTGMEPLLLQTDGDGGGDLVVSAASVRSRLRGDGTVESKAAYDLDGAVQQAVLVFPEGVEPVTFRWNGTRFEPRSNENGEYRLGRPRRSGDGSETLEVEFVQTLDHGFGWTSRHRLDGPALRGASRVEQLVWEVVLPHDQYLFALPGGVNPAFRWRREGVFWRRQPLPEYAGAGAPVVWPAVSDGNSYAFTRLGHVEGMTITSMNQSFIVLLGAGVALVVGFVLLKVRATHSVLSILLLAFLLSAAGLWYPEPVRVLLQPAVFGLVLALVAAQIENAVKRPRGRTVVRLSASDIVSPSPSSVGEARRPPDVGPDDATVSGVHVSSLPPAEPVVSESSNAP